MKKINLIDVGALDGLDHPWRQRPELIDHLLFFEPNETSVIKDKMVKYNAAIWNFEGNSPFYISGEKGSGSSLLKQNFEWVKANYESLKKQGNEKLNETWFERSTVSETREIKVTTLDNVLDDLKRKQPEVRYHFLKSDTQSGEGFVLKGAQRFLDESCVGLELELFRYPLYQGMILDHEVKEFLKDFGFELAGWGGYKNSFLSQYDALFIKKRELTPEQEQLVALIMKIYNPKGKKKLIKQKSIWQKARRRLNL